MALSCHIFPLGDQGLTVHLGDTVDETVNACCLDLAAAIDSASIPGVRNITPAYNTVAVHWNMAEVTRSCHTHSAYHYLHSRITAIINALPKTSPRQNRSLTIPACFHPSIAPDLQSLSQQKRMSTGEVIELFTAGTYRVYMLGFLPGFPYMGTVNQQLAMPRKESPHLHIAAGSIGIAGIQAGIYPLDSPGGWNIIGRTPLRIFSSEATHPCLFRPGDHVRFQPLEIEEFHQLNQHL